MRWVLKQRGMTLVELLVAATLTGLVAVGVGTVYGVAFGTLQSNMNSMRAQNEVSYAIEHVKRNLIRASNFQILSSGSVLEYTQDGTIWGRYQVSSVSGSNPPRFFIFHIPNRNFPLVGEEVLGQDFTDPLGTGTPVAFAGISATELGVDLAVQSGTGPRAKTIRLQTRVTPRGMPQ